MAQKTCSVMIVAGEASGDGHAAKLVRSLRDLSPETEFEFFGAAGPAMRQAGVESVVVSDDLAIMGIIEIGMSLPTFVRAMQRLRTAALERRPEAVVLVDFPEFNLRLARWLKRHGFRVIYYISPQLWAWRQYRVRTVRRSVDLMLSILPFEKDWYASRGVNLVEYVGSPLVNEVSPSVSRDEFRSKHGLNASDPLIALLPGSRPKEIERILPELLSAASLIKQKRPEAQFVVALSEERHLADFECAMNESEKNGIRIKDFTVAVAGETYDALGAADAAAVASGTATLETGLIGTPLAVVYRASPFSYRLLRPLIEVEHFGLINLIAGERIAKELIQDDFTPPALSAEMLRLLDPEVNESVREKLRAAAHSLGEGGASKRAAKCILNFLGFDPVE